MNNANSRTTLIPMMTVRTVTDKSMILIRRIYNIRHRKNTFRTIIRAARIMVGDDIGRHMNIYLTRPNITLVAMNITNVTHANACTGTIRCAIIPNMINPWQYLLIQRWLRTISFMITFLRFQLNRNMDNGSFRIFDRIKGHFRLGPLRFRFAHLTNGQSIISNNNSVSIFLNRIVRHYTRRNITTKQLMLSTRFPLLTFN